MNFDEAMRDHYWRGGKIRRSGWPPECYITYNDWQIHGSGLNSDDIEGVWELYGIQNPQKYDELIDKIKKLVEEYT